jgi:4-amino-4-deoxy-L-arabinose transferase-like glycosyltransferase
MSFWYGISGDEVDMNNYGKAILDYYTSFGANKNALSMPKELDRDGVLHLYGGFYDLVAAIVNKFSPFSEYDTRHLLNAWAGFLAIFFAAKLCIRFSGYRAATLVVWLMFLAPFFLGHAMNNPKDVPFAAAYIAGIYCFIKFYDKLPQVKWKDYIWPIISLAIAIDIRVAGILLVPFMAVYHVFNMLFNKSDAKPLRQIMLPLAIVSVCGYLGASLLWPYALQNPITNPF